MHTYPVIVRHPGGKAWQFLMLCKPNTTGLIVFTAISGMYLATTRPAPLALLFNASLGMALAFAAAAVLNNLLERDTDAIMAHTRLRALPSGQIGNKEALVFAILLAGTGLFILYEQVNPLTMWLTFASAFFHVVIYTVFLKPATSMSIVMGAASGAMAPVLGWTAVSHVLEPEPFLLFLIILLWTPPHFWSLALYHKSDHERSGLPILPVTHGEVYTRRLILRYILALSLASFLPYVAGLSGWFYLFSALVLDILFLSMAIRLGNCYDNRLAFSFFKFSITYLTLLFTALLADHYLPF